MDTMFNKLNSGFMKNWFILIFTSLLHITMVKGQLMIEQGPSGSTRDGSLIVYGLTGSGNRLPYEKIKGSPFLFDEWKSATLYHANGKSFGVYQAKLNLATQEVHYKDSKGQELADNGSIAKLVFEEATSEGTTYVACSNNIEEVNRNYPGSKRYAFEMNPGEVSLLKVYGRSVAQGDSLFGTLKRYYFTDKIDYYLKINNRIEKLKRLGEDEIVPFLPGLSSYRTWLKTSKMRLSKEEDLVKFLVYYNKQRSSSQ
jgi:hypothetical protein